MSKMGTLKMGLLFSLILFVSLGAIAAEDVSGDDLSSDSISSFSDLDGINVNSENNEGIVENNDHAIISDENLADKSIGGKNIVADDSVSVVGNDEKNIVADDSVSVVGNDKINDNFNQYSADDVSNSKDVITYQDNPAGTFTDLSNVINQAISTNRVVDLDRNYTYVDPTDTPLKSGIDITGDDNFTINGNGFVINASDLSAIFHYKGSGVITINNLTLCNAKSDQGSALNSDMGYSNIYNSLFMNCNSTGVGGAVFVSGQNSTIINSSFINNTAEMCGAIHLDTGNIFNSTFKNNSAIYYGGAIGGTDFNVYGSNFENNSVSSDTDTGDGGAALAGGNIIVVDSNFTNNYAECLGVIRGVEITSINSTFVNNFANQGGAIYGNSIITSINSTFINNSAEQGGALTSGDIIVNGSSFIGNNVSSLGGAIYSDHKVLVDNSSFVNNSAVSGGAICGESNYSKIAVFNSSFIGNNVSSVGGAIGGFNVNVSGSSFVNNSAVSGGDINASNVLANNSIFMGSTATNGENIYLNGSFVSNNSFWNYNFKDREEFLNSNLIKFVNGSFACPDWWVVMNVTGPENVSSGENLTYSVTANTLFNGTDYLIDDSALPDFTVNFNSNALNISDLVIHQGDTNINYLSNQSGLDNLVVSNVNNGSTIVTKPIDVIESKFSTSITNDFIITEVNGSVTVNVSSPNGTVDQGHVEITCNGTIIGMGNLTNGSATFNISNLDAGNYSIIVYYVGTDDFMDANKTINLEVDPVESKFSTSITNDFIITEVNGSVTVNVSSPNGTVDQGHVEIICNGTIIGMGNLTNGSATFNISDLDVGNYSIEVNYVGTDDFMDSNKTINLEVDPVESKFSTSITTDYIITEVNGSVTVTVISPNGTVDQGHVEITCNGTIIGVGNVTNGSAIFNISDLDVGNYSIEVNYVGTDDFMDSNKTINLEVDPVETMLNTVFIVKNMTTSALSGDLLNITLCDELGNFLSDKNVSLTLFNSVGGNKTYYVTTDANGSAYLKINLREGNYSILAKFDGDENYNLTNATVNITVESNDLIMSADNYTNVFGQKGNFTTKLTDSKGNALVGYECILRLYNYLGEHKDYYRTTNTEGVAKLNIGLIPGNWTIECFYPGSSLGPESNHSIGNVTITSE